MNTTEIFLIAMTIIFSLPWLVWRLARTDYVAPLVVVQILAGIVLGPGVLGALFPDYYRFVFNPTVVQSLSGVAWWAVMLFVCIAGIELDLGQAWRHRRESGITAGLALGVPMAAGAAAAVAIWRGRRAGWAPRARAGSSCRASAWPARSPRCRS
jgi:Kef-type K+ transport system membrane component KefB